MSSQSVLIGLLTILLLGIGAQWLAWRLRLPAILLLLLFGCLAGPGSEWLAPYLGYSGRLLDPNRLLGDLLLPAVSMAVAIILFEGGLTLSLAELSQSSRVISSLVTVGALVTWVLAMIAGWGVLQLNWQLAMLLGAILVVTGPTVIGPLLRHVRPTGPVGPILKWEGIVIDPIGALLTVVVFEAVAIARTEHLAFMVVGNVAKTILIGSLLGLGGAVLLVLLLRRYWIPDYLQSPIALTLVLLAFGAANLLQRESGLFAATVMGIVLANQRRVAVRHILEFKENLTVLLISSLFILLAARLRLEDLSHLRLEILLFLAFLIVVVRPLGVAASTIGSPLSWRERAFLACMAPRGIVAAAVSSVFALHLQEAQVPGAEVLVPYTFAVIIGTVTVYGLIAGRAAARLGLARPGRRGFLIAGANPLARAIGTALKNQGYEVLLADTNRQNLSLARMEGLSVYFGSILSEQLLDRLELTGIGRLLALTPNEEVNALATLQFARVFGRSDVYQLPPEHPESARLNSVSRDLRGRQLFGKEMTYAHLSSFLRQGATIRKTTLSREFDFQKFKLTNPGKAIPLFLLDEAGQLFVFNVDHPPTPRPGQALLSLMQKADVILAAQE